MSIEFNPDPVKASRFSWFPVISALIMAFVFFMISASIAPINNAIARYTLCPTASDAYFKEESGGTVHKLGVQQDVSGKVVTLYCEYENQPAKEIKNDIVVTTGFGVSAGLGAIMGLIVYLVMLIQSRRK